MNKNDRIFVAGHKGLVGSAIIRELNKKGYKKIITASKSSLDITKSIYSINPNLDKTVKQVFLIEFEHTEILYPSLTNELINLIRVLFGFNSLSFFSTLSSKF